MVNIKSVLIDIKKELEQTLLSCKQGQDKNIKDIEKKSQDICNKLSKMEKKEALDYKEEIENIIYYLTEISKTVKERYDVLSSEIKETHQRNTANKAYGQSIKLNNQNK